jgi:hypothetical protein
MNNEPVAWMQVHYKDNKPTKFSKVKTWEDDVPLYAHPYKPSKSEVDALLDNADYVIGTMREEIEKLKTKTLTDEEIEEVWIQALQDEPKVNAGKFPSLANQPFVFYARAILRKAQEK